MLFRSPASRPIWSVALTSPDGSRSQAELSAWADQVLKKRLENVRGVGSVTLVGASKREVNVYLRPEALESYQLGAAAVADAVRTETRNLPAGTLRQAAREDVVQVDGRVAAPADMGAIVIARRNGQPVRLDQVARVVDGPEIGRAHV